MILQLMASIAYKIMTSYKDQAKDNSAEDLTPLYDVGIIDMPFGKHKGKTIKVIAEEDVEYLEWVAETIKDGIGADAREFIEQNPNVIPPPGKYVLGFGKHKGSSLEDLEYEGKEGYIEWLAENGAGIPGRKAKEYLGLNG